MTTFQKNVDIKDHNGTDTGLKLGGTLLEITADQLNALGTNVTISYAPGVATDSIVATFQVTDLNGNDLENTYALECYISDDDDGKGLTSTSASGALTDGSGEILSVLTAKKHVKAVTNDNGELELELVDSANTAFEYFCVVNPSDGRVIVGPATQASDYEGGS